MLDAAPNLQLPVPDPLPSDDKVARAGGPKVYSTPAILAMLEPNSYFKLSLKHNDHRFEVKCTTPHEEVYIEPFNKKTYSKSFAGDQCWKYALQCVHRRCWDKWQLVADKYPLGPGKEAQVPGEVPAHVLEALEEKMTSMPPVVRYPKP